MSDLPPPVRRFLTTDDTIVGLLLGLALTGWSLHAYLTGAHLLTTAVGETFWVAAYLTMVVAYCGFSMPVFLHRSPFWSTFTLIVFCGHISLLFDSFAVVLLLSTGVTFLPLPGTKERFNAFAVKTAAAFCALTVGGGFYLGELWGLPYYISNGLDVPLAGFPLLLVLTPYCMMVAYLVAKHYPVQMQETVFDKQQLLAAVEFSTALILLIVTQSPFLCIGALLLYTALRRKTDHLVQKTAHELMGGAQHALGLVILAVIILESGNAPLVQPYLSGVGLFIGAAISSPFAGAMAPAANNLHDFYVGLSLLMCGAPLFVFSSLVAIVVFTGTIDYEDMPGWMKPLTALVGGKKQGFVQEALTYTLFILPLTAGLGILLFVANQLDLFATAATWLGVSMGTPPASH